jgi:hypothetical protein
MRVNGTPLQDASRRLGRWVDKERRAAKSQPKRRRSKSKGKSKIKIKKFHRCLRSNLDYCSAEVGLFFACIAQALAWAASCIPLTLAYQEQASSSIPWMLCSSLPLASSICELSSLLSWAAHPRRSTSSEANPCLVSSSCVSFSRWRAFASECGIEHFESGLCPKLNHERRLSLYELSTMWGLDPSIPGPHRSRRYWSAVSRLN